MSKSLKIILSIIFVTVCSICVANIIMYTDSYPNGSDVYGHLFKINELYTSICNGNFYPIYSSSWYNSIELFRYWPPLSYYFYCIFMFLTNGDIYFSFILFSGVIFFIGSLGWILFGIRENKLFLCTIISLLWFFLPDNMRVFFSEGNIPRIFINALLPLLFFLIMEFINYNKKITLIPIYFLIIFIINSHIMISAMVGITIFIYLFIDTVLTRTYKKQLILLLNCLLAYISSALILLPGLTGGLLAQNSSASVNTSNTWSQELFKSFNPFIRLENLDVFYFGISILIICILGLFVLHNKTFAGFFTCFLIFIGTSTAAANIISRLPLSQALWMSRFIPIAITLFFISFINWKELKNKIKYIFIFIIMIDCLFSLRFFNTTYSSYLKIQENMEKDFLLNEANSIASNRIALMDLSELGSYPSFYFPQENKKYLFGWAYQGAYNIENLVSLNEAFEKGYYIYMFDRLIEYGCDTVIIKKDEIKKENIHYFKECAKKLNFQLINENKNVYLYKLPINTTFGTINKYENIAIGKSSNYICYLYPSFHKLQNEYLDEYTFKDLSNYKKIYLSGFKYHDLSKAEELISKLSNSGIKVYIDMNDIPDDISGGKKHFLGVYSQSITFTKEFPVLEKKDGKQFKLKLNTDKYSKWQTVYLTSLDKVMKKSEYNKNKFLDYIGTSNNENVVFIGLNLVYYCTDSDFYLLKTFLDEIFEVNDEIVPNRDIVKFKVEYNYNNIKISSDYDNLNTNLSYLDCFYSDKQLIEENCQILVNKGETILTIKYTYLKEGLLISLLSFVITVIYWFFIIKDKRRYFNE